MIFTELEPESQVTGYGTGKEGEEGVGCEGEVVYWETFAEDEVCWVAWILDRLKKEKRKTKGKGKKKNMDRWE